MKNISFFVIVFICIGCDLNNQKLKLVNASNGTVYYRLLNDTVLYSSLYVYKLNLSDSVYPDYVMGLGDGAWEHKINHESIDSSLHVFIFRAESFLDNRLTDEAIKKGVYKRFDFKVKDLERIGWRFVYKQ